MFEPLVTERLLLRQPTMADVPAFHAYRNEPDVARWQDWPTPFARERAEAVIGEAAAMAEVGCGEWMMLTIADADDTEVYGDLFVEFENNGRTGGIGYSLAHSAWGKGYAVEAVSALVAWLFERDDFTRAWGSLHPDNLRSARVLENCGFVFEGHTRNSYWLDDENSDDWIYGLTPEQHHEWRDRPRNTPRSVELVEPDPRELRTILSLATHHSQQRFVSPVSVSLAEVAIPPFEDGFGASPDDQRTMPWVRIVHADDEPVGFVMVGQSNAARDEPILWRLLIDRLHQRRGIGEQVVELVIEQARRWWSTGLVVSWIPGVGSPEPMYLGLGFVPTGEMDGDEIVARRDLA